MGLPHDGRQLEHLFSPASEGTTWSNHDLRQGYFTLGDELLDVIPVQRNWRFGAVEQDPNAAIEAAGTDNSAFLFGEARTTGRAEHAHPEPRPYRNGLSR